MHVKTQKAHHIPNVKLPHFSTPRPVGKLHKPSKLQSKRFVKEYSMPLAVTVFFIVAVLGVLGVRASERSALLELLPSISEISEGYSDFVSGDKADEFTKNQDNADAGAGGTTAQTPNPAGTASSFAINSGAGTGSGSTGGGSSGGGSSGGGGTVSFSSSIASFSQSGGGTLECSGPQTIPKCSKRYTFGAGVRTSNGPGTVSYSWRSNFTGANQDAGFSVGGGTITTPLSKQIVIPCKDDGTYTLQLVLNSPTPTQSTVLSFNHNCIGI